MKCIATRILQQKFILIFYYTGYFFIYKTKKPVLEKNVSYYVRNHFTIQLIQIILQ